MNKIFNNNSSIYKGFIWSNKNFGFEPWDTKMKSFVIRSWLVFIFIFIFKRMVLRYCERIGMCDEKWMCREMVFVTSTIWFLLYLYYYLRGFPIWIPHFLVQKCSFTSMFRVILRYPPKKKGGTVPTSR